MVDNAVSLEPVDVWPTRDGQHAYLGQVDGDQIDDLSPLSSM
jgi:hypothetical protein